MSDKELRTLDLPFKEARAEVRDGRTLVGYAAVFNRPVEVDSWKGHFVETILPGAFRKTLLERSDQIRVLFNHGKDPSVGQKPLGRPSVLKEDDRGLYAEIPLDETSYNKDIIASVRSGALSGMSIQFEAMEDDWSDDRSERRIKQVALYELGPVTFPAQELATMDIRSQHLQQIQAQAESSSEGGRDTDLGRHTEFLDRLTRERRTDLKTKELEVRIIKL